MAEAKPPSTSDLLFLITGLHLLKNPDTTADLGEDYYLNPPKQTDERTLRETNLNSRYLSSPEAAWDGVRFRDWLIARLFGEIAGKKHEFQAISEALLFSKDVLAKSFTRDMAGVTDAIRDALLSKSSKERSYFSTLTFGISKQKVGSKDVYLFGAGFRRRAQLFLTSEEALQADVECFVPFFILPNSDHGSDVSSSSVRSFCAGIAITNSRDHALGMDDGKELVAMRFNLRIPFKAELVDETELRTEFGKPEINIEKRVKESSSPTPSKKWEKFTNWKKFLDQEYFERPEIGELLNCPIGPLLAEKISDGSGVKDLILKQSKRDEIKTSIAQVKEDLDDTLSLLKNIWEWEPPDKKKAEPNSGNRRLGSLLVSLGFMTAKPAGGGDFDYTFKVPSDLKVWNVVDRILDELDGFPLYVSGVEPKKDKEKRYAISLASQSNPSDTKTKYFGLAGLAYNILLNPVKKDATPKKKEDPDESWIFLTKDNFTGDESILVDLDEDEDEEEVKEEPTPAQVEKSKYEVLLHLGKWFSNETLDDNWFMRLLPKSDAPGKQRVPLPGMRVLPIKRLPSQDPTKATFNWTLVIDLLSLGVDIRGTTKDGLKFLEGLAGYFGLGAVEIRTAIKVSFEDLYQKKGFFDRVTLGIGIKLKDLRLSLGPKEKDDKKKEKGDDILGGLQQLLADDWEVVPAPKPTKRNVKTRLAAKKKDKFSISIGYLSPLKKDGYGTLDIQLYDEKGVRGKMAVVAIDRSFGPVYLKQIGIGLKGVENYELKEGLPDSAQLTVSLTGGLRFPVFELGFIGAKMIFQLNNPGNFKFALDGLDVSVKIGPVIISGSFMKIGVEYAGSLTVSIPKGSFSAMGFYGSIILFDLSREPEIVTNLNEGKLHTKMLAKLTAKKFAPATVPVRQAAGGGWELYTADNNQFTITDEGDKLIVLRPDKTLFIYITLSAASGTGITVGPIQFTAIVFGYGYNRRAIIPTIDDVADFPLVKIVMGEGGYQEEDESLELHRQLAKPVDDPIAIFEKMKDYLVPELGQQFACGGVRFTIAGIVDCFALIVVQWGEDIEISLLGLARFRQPRDLSSKAICYVEMQILMSIKPSEGTFKLQALLSDNSWVITQDCKLTGGFAVFIWFDGEHKGDFVVTLGGYHPRFRRPEHYPVVPRLGLNWRVNDNLSIKGGVYLAFTPSCGMLGARMEATFRSGRISAWFTAYLDVIINWSPLYFEADIGISLRVEASFFLTSINVTLSVSLQMWGPPVGGIAHVDLTVVSFDIPFGKPRPDKPELVESWQQFCHKFLNLQGGDRRALKDPVPAFPIVQPNLAAGRNNLNTLPNTLRSQPAPKPEDGVWKVRADELQLAAAATVPVLSLNVGTVGTQGVQARNTSGRSMMVTKAIQLERNGLRTEKSKSTLGIHPMGKGFDSVLNVTVIRDDGSEVEPVPLSDWTMKEERGALPAALWETGQPNLRLSEPSAKLMEGCITGLKQLKPPRGTLGKAATPPPIEWHPLTPGRVAKSAGAQAKPVTSSVRNVQPVVVQKLDEQKKVVDSLKAVGFTLTWQAVPAADVRFRELQADPLAGAVAS